MPRLLILSVFFYSSACFSDEAGDFLTLRQYVSECEEADLESPANVNCAEGEELPVSVTTPKTALNPEKKIQVTRDNYAAVMGHTSCDHPALVQSGNAETECIPNARVQVIKATKGDSFCVLLCRKTNRSLPENEFQDLSMICHERKKGSTCFFVSKVAHLFPDQPKESFSYKDRDVLGPGSPRQKLWMEPKDLDQASRCVNCHDADPFAISPNLGPFGKTFRTRTSTRTKDPYRIVGTKRPFTDKVWNERWFLAAPDNGCTSCHRIGAGILGGCGYLREEAVGASLKSHHSTTAKLPWMPPSNTPAKASYKDDIEHIRTCCDERDHGLLASKACHWQLLPR